HELRIVSVMVEDVPDDGLPIRRVPPIPIHFRPDQRMNVTHNHLAGTNNYVSKTVSLPRLIRPVRRRRSEFHPDVIPFVEHHAAVKTANLVLDRGGSKFAFLFCLKPEPFKASFRASERPGLRVFGSAEAFHAARLAADVFLSPIQDARSTAAPPLAWLEALAMGIPILTTNIPGSEEAVVDGVSGLRVRSPEAASERLLELASNDGQLQRLREGARQVAVDRYSVDRSLG